MSASSDEMRRKRQLAAWELRCLCHLNVCYWQRKTARARAKRKRLVGMCSGSGLAIGIAMKFIQGSFILSAATVAISVVGGILSLLKDGADTSRAKFAYKVWSDLCCDVDSLWRVGESEYWKKRDIEIRAAALEERAKSNHSHESDPDDRALVDECHAVINARLGQCEKGSK